jgi:hypothetical protein
MESIEIDLAVVNHSFGETGIAVQTAPWGKPRNFIAGFGIASRGGIFWRNTAGLNVIDQRPRNGIGVISQVIFDVGAVLANVVRPDGASILQMDDVGRGADHRARRHEQDRPQEKDDRGTH